ncbi:hypothetical protein EV424DRAFT_574386 [Suillus variegatus]|nr:hypothetical protein EV424DRAFT_574386 [Suillus variegatus]
MIILLALSYCFLAFCLLVGFCIVISAEVSCFPERSHTHYHAVYSHTHLQCACRPFSSSCALFPFYSFPFLSLCAMPPVFS